MGDTIRVDHDVKKCGHQIDVWWEFSRGGVDIQVAVECKDQGEPVEKTDVWVHSGKLDSIQQKTGTRPLGVIVATNEFRSTTLEQAKANGISCIRVIKALDGVGVKIEIRVPLWSFIQFSVADQTQMALLEKHRDIVSRTLFSNNGKGPAYGDGLLLDQFTSQKEDSGVVQLSPPLEISASEDRIRIYAIKYEREWRTLHRNIQVDLTPTGKIGYILKNLSKDDSQYIELTLD